MQLNKVCFPFWLGMSFSFILPLPLVLSSLCPSECCLTLHPLPLLFCSWSLLHFVLSKSLFIYILFFLLYRSSAKPFCILCFSTSDGAADGLGKVLHPQTFLLLPSVSVSASVTAYLRQVLLSPPGLSRAPERPQRLRLFQLLGKTAISRARVLLWAWNWECRYLTQSSTGLRVLSGLFTE